MHIIDITWISFVINKGTWINYMKGLQVSGTFSEEYCGHLAQREDTLSGGQLYRIYRLRTPAQFFLQGRV